MSFITKISILATGDDQQISQMIEEEKQRLQKQEQTMSEYERQYRANHNKPIRPETQEHTISAALTFLQGKIKTRSDARPEGLTIDIVRQLFWPAYRMIVKAETDIDLKPDTVRNDPALATAMRNFCHWIIRSDKGEWNPNQSLYLWGDLGVGKSTLARAAEAVMAWIRTTYSWEPCNFAMVAMDQVFLEVYTTENLATIRSMATGNLIIDELKEEHTRYRHYGNDLPILEIVLQARHELWKKGKRTIITTNIAPNQLVNHLPNQRLRDRMLQEYHAVQITGDNKRHPKARLKNS